MYSHEVSSIHSIIIIILQNRDRPATAGVDGECPETGGEGWRNHAGQAERRRRGARELEADCGSGSDRVHAAVRQGSSDQQLLGATASAAGAAVEQVQQRVTPGGHCRELGGLRRPPFPPPKPRGQHDQGAPPQDETQRPRPGDTVLFGAVRVRVERLCADGALGEEDRSAGRQ